MSQQIADHISNMAKVTTGGGVTAAATYVSVDWMTQATEYATLAAAVTTTIYFIISSLYALYKWRKEVNGKSES